MKIISIIISIIISFASSGLCFADNKNVKTYKFENDIKMNGVVSSSSKFIDKKNNWNIKNAKLNLVFTKSELLDVDYSTITILINDTPIHSQRLDGKKEYKKESIIDIPKELIKDGYNEINIKAYKTISDVVCRDDANTANWLVIHKESNVNIEYDSKEIPNLLSEYQNIYVNKDNGLRLNTSILIPDNYSSGELSSAMILSSDFGKKIKYDNFNFDLKLYSEFKDENQNLIYIGKKSNSPLEILNLLTDNEKNNLNDTCIIKQVNSETHKDKKRLIIISNNDQLLKNASKLLSSDDLVKNLNKSSVSINKNTDINDLPTDKKSNRIYLEELGYENILLKGPFSQEIIMDINTLKSKVATNSSKIKFNIRYAQNLDFERSLATVYINDVPIGSHKLSKDKSDNDIIELNLPNDVLGKNYYQIKVIFNLELLDLACVTRDTDNPWAYISKDSFIEFVYSDNKDLNFNNYPYPFIDSGKFNDIKVIIPNNSKSTQLTNIANIIAYMGRDIYVNYGEFSVVKENESRSNLENSNLLIIGTPSDNSIIKEINSQLNLKFKTDYKGFESDNNIKFIDEYSSEVSSIQMIKSPYNKEKTAIIVSSTNPNDLSLSTTYLSDLNLTKSLKGDTIIVGRNGYIKDLNYNKSESTLKEEKNEKKKITSKSKIFIGVSVFILIIVIISVVFLILKHRK